MSRRYASLVLQQAGLPDNHNNVSADFATDESLSDYAHEHYKVNESSESPKRSQKNAFVDEYTAKSLSKVRVAREMRISRETDYARQKFDRIKLEKIEERKKYMEECSVFLESVQMHLAAGEYQVTLKLMSSIKLDRIGSSSDACDFYCNVLFYRTVAMGEYALSSLPFNSAEQKQTINEALNTATIAMESSPEQRTTRLVNSRNNYSNK